MGDRKKNLTDALEGISQIDGTYLGNVSNIYETNPVGYVEQGKFLNMVVEIQTDLLPLNLLKELQNIETLLKRTREIHWGPRTIDIDILLFEDVEINHPALVIPHPRTHERAFVLVPLKDVYPYKELNGMDIDELIDKCNDKDGIKLYNTGNG